MDLEKKVKVVTTGLGQISESKMDKRVIVVVTLFLLSCIELSIGKALKLFVKWHDLSHRQVPVSCL